MRRDLHDTYNCISLEYKKRTPIAKFFFSFVFERTMKPECAVVYEALPLAEGERPTMEPEKYTVFRKSLLVVASLALLAIGTVFATMPCPHHAKKQQASALRVSAGSSSNKSAHKMKIWWEDASSQDSEDSNGSAPVVSLLLNSKEDLNEVGSSDSESQSRDESSDEESSDGDSTSEDGTSSASESSDEESSDEPSDSVSKDESSEEESSEEDSESADEVAEEEVSESADEGSNEEVSESADEGSNEEDDISPDEESNEEDDISADEESNEEESNSADETSESMEEDSKESAASESNSLDESSNGIDFEATEERIDVVVAVVRVEDHEN